MANPSSHEPSGGPPDLSLKRRFVALPTLISFALAIALIAILLTRFDIDLGETWRTIKGSDAELLVLAFALYYLTFPFRGLRWRLLMRNAGVFREAGAPQPSLTVHSEMILVSWFANSISWFHMGDAYRAFLMSTRLGASFSRIIGTVLAERMVDVFVVFALLIVAGVGLLQDDETSDTAGAIVIGAAALAALVLVALLVMRGFGQRIVQRLPARVRDMYARFQEGTLGSFRNLPSLIVITSAIWTLEAARLYFVVEAMGFEIGLALILFAALAHSLLTTVPITPGGLGVVELGLAGLLALSANIGSTDAAAITLVDRSITYFSVLIIGGIAFAVFQARTVRRTPSEQGLHTPAEPT